MEKSPYPDRILAHANLGVTDLAELKKRTLTNLYNQRPAWLADAHPALDAAMAAAYGLRLTAGPTIRPQSLTTKYLRVCWRSTMSGRRGRELAFGLA